MLFLFSTLVYSTKLSEYCTSGSPQTKVTISEFDIPFQNCGITNFNNIQLLTTYKVLRSYFKSYRALQISKGLKLTVDNVISGDILDFIDVQDGTLELNLDKNILEIEGNVRVDKQAGGSLIINGK